RPTRERKPFHWRSRLCARDVPPIIGRADSDRAPARAASRRRGCRVRRNGKLLSRWIAAVVIRSAPARGATMTLVKLLFSFLGKLLFSFGGRINRAKFWLGWSIAIVYWIVVLIVEVTGLEAVYALG